MSCGLLQPGLRPLFDLSLILGSGSESGHRPLEAAGGAEDIPTQHERPELSWLVTGRAGDRARLAGAVSRLRG